ncbi:hypothetical protein Purlil1_2730 [Purpureocillium lilacinum]|uniref:Uncharacterized protein n=1 Tax=Purpureocillium lilacinum TaxID=33203 RepID=A0ABR0C9D0_PURLI|nr:hypothetical protein Purlil1_2730 [Purpureocillium lilacinum]
MAPEQTRLFRQSSTKTTYDGVRVCMSCQVAGWTHGRTDGILPDACGRHVRVFPSLSLSVGVACLGRRGAFSPSHQRPARLACRVSFRARARSLASAFPLANSQPVTNKVQHMTDRPTQAHTPEVPRLRGNYGASCDGRYVLPVKRPMPPTCPLILVPRRRPARQSPPNASRGGDSETTASARSVENSPPPSQLDWRRRGVCRPPDLQARRTVGGVGTTGTQSLTPAHTPPGQAKIPCPFGGAFLQSRAEQSRRTHACLAVVPPL